ncbi:substrate-binding domain-containing protein [Streptomyces sp. 7N604]|uniref:substrate-binding domain-containing protein n=1 Tax=Streptomyces sp. 7N604 TaxID=3457415 RepID=UPI003FCEF372
MTFHVPARDGSRAILVGIPDVAAPGFEELRYVDRNLADLRDALSHPERGILEKDAITVLPPSEGDEPSPGRKELLEALRSAGRETADLLLVYFVGHGYRAPLNNQLYLMTRNAHLDDLVGTAVAWTDVLEKLGGMHFKRAVFILDCCNSGVAAEGGGVGTSGHYILTSALPTKTQPLDSVECGRSRFTHEIICAMESLRPDSEQLTMQGLYDGLYDVMSRWNEDVDFGDGWGPKGRSGGDGPGIVIALPAAVPVPPPQRPRLPPPPPPPPPLPPWLQWLQWLKDRWKTVPAVAVALALAVVTGAYLTSRDGGGTASECPPPLELRLMAGTETRDAAQRAVTAYMKDGADRERLGGDDHAPADCRRANFTVYDAGTGDTVDAFGATPAWAGRVGDESGPTPMSSSSGDGADSPCMEASGSAGVQRTAEQDEAAAELCFDPLQDVGPQPDLVLPGSTTELGRIQAQLKRTPGPATVKDLGPVGYSPLVLAVPASLEEKLEEQGVSRTGSTWEQLLEAMDKAAPGMPLLRPDPDTSGTGLLHTVALYEAHDGVLAGGAKGKSDAVERRLRKNLPDTAPAADADGLLCALYKGEVKDTRLGEAAALVSEKAVADFNLGKRRDSACDNSKPADRKSRFLAYYPKGVPALDMPLAEVRWGGGRDRELREAAIEHFRAWLTGEEGRRVFLGDLVRGAGAGGNSPRLPSGQASEDTEASGILKDVPVVTDTAGGSTADDVVADYTRTRTPGQVLFLVDVSGSMAEGGKRALAATALRRSLQRLGSQDSYGIWSYPKSATEPAEARVVIEPGTPGDTRAKALTWADALPKQSMVPKGAAVYEVLTRAMREMHAQDRPLIVLITDGDNRPQGGRGTNEQAAMRDEQRRGRSAGVLVLSVAPDGCTTAISEFKNPPRAGCFSGRPDEAAERLAEQVANEVQGGTGDEGR